MTGTNVNFDDKKNQKSDIYKNNKCLSIIMLDSAIKVKKKYYP